MKGSLLRILAAVLAVGCWSSAASATPINVGLLAFDDLSPNSAFDIYNLTGTSALPPDYPITTQLTIGVTSLTVNLLGGGAFILDSNDFTSDASGNLTCTTAGDASTGGCNFAAYQILNAILIGTLSPTSGLSGLPAGFTGLLSGFTTTLTPGCDESLVAGCDFTNIQATLVPTATPVPEPSTVVLLQLGMGAWASYKFRGKATLLRRFVRRAE